MEEIFIALVPTEFSRIQIQTTVFMKEGKTYVNTVNIIYEGRILEKIKQEAHKELKYLDPDKIASDYIFNKLKINNKKSKRRTTTNKKNAANAIMNEFNL
jgi:hypothetical protein